MNNILFDRVCASSLSLADAMLEGILPVGQTLYNTENNSYYSESIYDDNYDYQSPPKR